MIGTEIRTINQLKNLAIKSEKGLKIFTISYKGEYVVKGTVFPCNMGASPQNKTVLFLISSTSDNTLKLYKSYNISFHEAMERVEQLKNHIDPKYYDCIEELIKNGAVPLVTYDTLQEHESMYGRIRIAVADDFDEKYEQFTKDNKKATESVFFKYLAKNDNRSQLLYALTDGNPAFFSWAAKAIGQYHTNLFTIIHLLAFNNECGSLVKRLSKQNIIALTNPKEITTGIWESFHLRAEMIANKTVSLFNPKQKKLLKERLDDIHVVSVLNNFSRLSMKKKSNFVRKVSTLENVDEIIHLMTFVCSNTYFNWNQESLHEFIKNVEGLNCKIVYEKNNITVLEVNDFETIKRLGKMTNWCISKNKSYWEQYIKRGHNPNNIGYWMPNPLLGLNSQNTDSLFKVDNDDEKSLAFRELMRNDDNEKLIRSVNKQFMIFDFNKHEDDILSIVGVTTDRRKGITNAHNFTNGNMISRHRGAIEDPLLAMVRPQEPNGWIALPYNNGDNKDEGKENPNCIYTYIKLRDIDINLFNNYKYKRFEWKKENLFSFLEQFVDEEDYDVIYDENNKVLIRSTNLRLSALMDNYSNIKNTFTMGVPSTIDKYLYYYFDFNETQDVKAKMLIYQIYDMNKNIEDAYGPFNEFGQSVNPNEPTYIEFTDLILSLNLPFDLIKRPDNLLARIDHYSSVNNIDKVLELIKKEPSFEIPYNIQEMFTNHLINSFVNECSFSFYDSILSLNRPLKDVFGKVGIKQILDICINKTVSLLWWREKNEIKFIETRDEINEYFKQQQKKFLATRDSNLNNLDKDNIFSNILGTSNGNAYLYILNDLMERAYREGEENMATMVLTRFLKDFVYYLNQDHRHKTIVVNQNEKRTFINDIMSRYIDRWTVIDLKTIGSLINIVITYPMIYDIVVDRIRLFIKSTGSKAKNLFALCNKLINIATNNKMSSELFLNLLQVCVSEIREKELLTEEEMNSLKVMIKEKVCKK